MTYRKALSRGAYGHDPFWSVFEEHRTWFHNNRYYNWHYLFYSLWGKMNVNWTILILWNQVDMLLKYNFSGLQKGSCPYAPLDKVLRYMTIKSTFCFSLYLFPCCDSKLCPHGAQWPTGLLPILPCHEPCYGDLAGNTRGQFHRTCHQWTTCHSMTNKVTFLILIGYEALLPW